MLLWMLLACGYSVEDWWKDLAQAHCDCTEPDNTRACTQELMGVYEGSPDWARCYDEAAPVDREDVRVWVKEYTETCQPPALAAPQPADPNWTTECE